MAPSLPETASEEGTMRLRGVFLTGALATAFVLAGAGVAEANNCRDRIQREEYKLQRDIRRHGLFSHQARNRRAKIQRLRRQCGPSFFAWGDNRGHGHGRWDRDDRRWRNRDRDDRRHDRDHWYWDGRRWRRR
jgi:hypothetical protein